MSELPLRPLTSAEVLDAATGVLRHRPVRLLAAAAVLAALEQWALYPLRGDLWYAPHDYWGYITSPGADGGAMWRLIAVGLGTEAAILALLGTFTGRSAARVLARSVPKAEVPTLPGRYGATAVVALVAGAVAAAGAWLGLVGWLFWFMLTGAAVPALVIDAVPGGPFGAIGRSFGLVRHGMRSGGLRLLAYLPWLTLRLVLSVIGAATILDFFGLRTNTAGLVVDYVAFVALNTVAYAMIASVDAVAHLETRMRLEGLDIALARAAATGEAVAPVLKAGR